MLCTTCDAILVRNRVPDWFIQRLMWIGLGNINLVEGVVRIIPDATKRSLLFKDIDGIKAALGKEVSEGQPISDVRLLKGSSTVMGSRYLKTYFDAATPPGPAPTTATRIIFAARKEVMAELRFSFKKGNLLRWASQIIMQMRK